MTHKFEPIIRRAKLDDAALLAELGARTFTETFAADNRPEDMASYLAAAFGAEQQSAELSDAQSVFFIAEVDEVAAGYAKLHPGRTPESVTGKRPIELVRLYAARAWLGRGIGAALMRECLNESRRAGYQTLWLGVWERNMRARAFYGKWDFRDVGKHIFQLGDDPQIDIVMERAVIPEEA